MKPLINNNQFIHKYCYDSSHFVALISNKKPCFVLKNLDLAFTVDDCIMWVFVLLLVVNVDKKIAWTNPHIFYLTFTFLSYNVCT